MRKILIALLGLIPGALFAQTGAVQDHCYLGGAKSVTSGLSSTNYLDGIIPSCTVTVYLTGTTTKATIYSNSTGTPLANPFTANSASVTNPGGWIFWAATNAGLDVTLSGGIAPNTYPSPLTITDVFPSQSFSPVAGVTNIIPGTNITCSTDSGGKCTGDVTVNAPGASPGAPDTSVQFNDAGAFTGNASLTFVGNGGSFLGGTLMLGDTVTGTGLQAYADTADNPTLTLKGATGEVPVIIADAGANGKFETDGNMVQQTTHDGTISYIHSDNSADTSVNDAGTEITATATGTTKDATALTLTATATGAATALNITAGRIVTPITGSTQCLHADSSGVVTGTGSDCGSGGGTTVNVNGSSVSNPNFNGTTPAAPAGATNKTFQVSSSNVSVYDYGVQYNPPTTFNALIGDSRLINDTDVNNATNAFTPSSYTCNGTNCTVTGTGGSGWSTNDFGIIWWPVTPSCMQGSWIQVSGSSSTTLTFPESQTNSCTGSISGSASGSIVWAVNTVTGSLNRKAFFKNHGTTSLLLQSASGDGSVVEWDALVATTISAWYTACSTAGGPCNLYISLGFDDLFATPCSSLTTLEGAYTVSGSFRKLFNDIHALGSISIIVLTEPTREASGVSCSNTPRDMISLNQWLVSQGGVGNATSGHLDYADFVIDTATPLGYNGNSNFFDTIHYSNQGASVFASAVNNGMASQGSWNLGQPASNGLNILNGPQAIINPQVYTTALGSAWMAFGGTDPNSPTFAIVNRAGINGAIEDGSAHLFWRWRYSTNPYVAVSGAGCMGFLNGSDPATSTEDSCFWRESAKVIDVGSTTLGDSSGTLKMANAFVSGLGSSTNPLCTTTGGQLTNSGCAGTTILAVPTVLDTTTPVTVSTTNNAEYHNNQNSTAATAVTYNLPTAAAGKQFCFTNSYNGTAPTTGVLTIATSASGQFIIFTDGTLSATGGNVTSGGAASDAACMVGVDATHWQMYVERGTWSKH